MILRDSWIWHDFFEALKDGATEKEVRQIAQRVRSPVLVALDAQTAEPTINWNEDRYGNKLPRDYIRYSRGEQWAIEEPAGEPALLQSLNKANSLAEVAERIQGLGQLDCIWIDILLGYLFTIEPRNGLPGYDSDSVWKAAGQPWKSWLRQSRPKR